MGHLFHIFGGGCGEHLVWPWLASMAAGLTMFRHYIKAASLRVWARLRAQK